MAKQKNTGLGRGLEAIFLDNSVEETGGPRMLRISEIEPNPDQPRKEFDEESLAELARSVAEHGLIQPIVVRNENENGYYQIIAGERRWRASKIAGLTEVPVIIMDVDDRKASELALVENLQREDLNPIDEASAFAALMESYGMTQEEVSAKVGKSRSAVANSLRLLDLPDQVLYLLKTGAISAGHGRALLGLKDPAQIVPTAELVSSRSLTVRETEELVKRINNRRKKPENPEPEHAVVDYYAELAVRMTKKLGSKVAIYPNAKTKRLEISYETDEDLEAIVKSLCGDNIFDE